MSGAGDQGSGAQGAELLEGERVDLAEHVGAQVCAESGDHVGADLGTGQNAAQTDDGDDEHLQTAQKNEVKIPVLDTVVENIRHQRRQQQITEGGKRDQQRCQDQLAQIGFQIIDNSFHDSFIM